MRDPEKTRSLLEESDHGNLTILHSDNPERVRECRLVVNATPIGTRGSNGSPLPLEQELLHSSQIVYDMVYNPLETPLLLAAKQAGATTLSGIEMLIGQAERSFTLWTGMQMPTAAVKEALLQEIQQQ